MVLAQITIFWQNPNIMLCCFLRMLFIIRGWKTGQVCRQDGWIQKQYNPSRKPVLGIDLRLGQMFIFGQDNEPKHTAKSSLKWFKTKKLNVSAWPSQSPDLNLIVSLWQDLKIVVHQWSPSNLTHLEQFCQEKWAKISRSRCIKLCNSNCSKRWFYQVLTWGINNLQSTNFTFHILMNLCHNNKKKIYLHL